MNVKDFVINENELEIKKQEKVKKKTVTDVKYEVVLENNTDFIVKRTTSRTSKLLVYLISQDVFYIKNEKTSEIESLNVDNLTSFGFRYTKNYAPQGFLYDKDFLKKCMWVNNNKDLLKVKDCGGIKLLIKNGFGNLFLINEIETINKYFNISPRLLVEVVKNYGYINKNIENLNERLYSRSMFSFLFETCRLFGYNQVMWFLKQIKSSHLNEFSLWDVNDFFEVIQTYNLNFNKIIKYLLFDLYKEGITNFEMHDEYIDYLRMTNIYYGKIRRKYPTYMRVQHDIIRKKYNFLPKNEINERRFMQIIDELKKFEFNGETYSIVAPTKAQDLIDEGTNLHHCVGSYIDSVKQKKCKILFLRKTEDLETSLVTVEIKGEDMLGQVQGLCRRPISEDEKEFIKQWCDKFNIKHRYA